jgi:hypothetical protein
VDRVLPCLTETSCSIGAFGLARLLLFRIARFGNGCSDMCTYCFPRKIGPKQLRMTQNGV